MWEDAAAGGLKDCQQSLFRLLDKVGQYIKGVQKKVQIKVSGVSDINTNFEVKDILQNIAWVNKC